MHAHGGAHSCAPPTMAAPNSAAKPLDYFRCRRNISDGTSCRILETVKVPSQKRCARRANRTPCLALPSSAAAVTSCFPAITSCSCMTLQSKACLQAFGALAGFRRACSLHAVLKHSKLPVDSCDRQSWLCAAECQRQSWTENSPLAASASVSLTSQHCSMFCSTFTSTASSAAW